MHFSKHRFEDKLNSFPDLIARVDLSTAGNPWAKCKSAGVTKLETNIRKQRICGSTGA